jgi:hypothetical protein
MLCPNFQNAVPAAGRNVLGRNFRRERDRALEPAEESLMPMHVFFFRFVHANQGSADGEHAAIGVEVKRRRLFQAHEPG